MKTVFLCFIVLVFGSCYTSKQAGKQVRKAHDKFPAVTANFCAETYPPIVVNVPTDSTDYNKWIDSIKRDTATERIKDTISIPSDCDSLKATLKDVVKENTALKKRVQSFINKPPPPLRDTTKIADSSLLKKAILLHQKEKAELIKVHEKEIKDLTKKNNNNRNFKNIFIGATGILFLLGLFVGWLIKKRK